MIRAAALLSAAFLAGCAGSRTGWASRGRYEVLHESPSLQVRRGSQKVDPRTGELVVSWIGARTPEGQPPLVACALTLFEDKDGDGSADAGEILGVRESAERSSKILFADVRAPKPRAGLVLVRMVASTERERCEVSWRLEPD